MRIRSRIGLAALIAAALFMTIPGLASRAGAQSQPSGSARPAVPFSAQPPAQPPSGSPAIAATRAGAFAFSLDDARNYVLSANPLQVARADVTPTITRMQFLAAKQISSLTGGEATGFPDDYMLCYVEMQGPFVFAGPRGARITFPRGIIIFDSATGNLVMAGGMQ